MREASSQKDLFNEDTWRRTFNIIPKLPFSFSYDLEDVLGQKSTMRVIDWEVGALYWNCLRAASGDKVTALAKVREKYFDSFLQTDLHFFLGTTQQWHYVAPNPFLIVGVFPIPSEPQLDLFV